MGWLWWQNFEKTLNNTQVSSRSDNSLLLVGKIKLQIASIFASFGQTCQCFTTLPKCITVALPNYHLVKLMVRLASKSCLLNSFIWWRSSDLKTSSRSASHPDISGNTWLTSQGKVSGTFLKPNGITLYCTKVSGVTNTDSSIAHSIRGISQYSFKRSKLLMNCAAPTWATQSSILGMGKQSGLMTHFDFH